MKHDITINVESINNGSIACIWDGSNEELCLFFPTDKKLEMLTFVAQQIAKSLNYEKFARISTIEKVTFDSENKS